MGEKVVNFEFSKFDLKTLFPVDRVKFRGGEDSNPWKGVSSVKQHLNFADSKITTSSI